VARGFDDQALLAEWKPSYNLSFAKQAAVELQARSPINTRLAVQRTMIGIFSRQHMRH
jgi:hypothetical protein